MLGACPPLRVRRCPFPPVQSKLCRWPARPRLQCRLPLPLAKLALIPPAPLARPPCLTPTARPTLMTQPLTCRSLKGRSCGKQARHAAELLELSWGNPRLHRVKSPVRVRHRKKKSSQVPTGARWAHIPRGTAGLWPVRLTPCSSPLFRGSSSCRFLRWPQFRLPASPPRPSYSSPCLTTAVAESGEAAAASRSS
jgi:hypothetical protein